MSVRVRRLSLARYALIAVLLAAAVASTSCTPPPPDLTPQATAAFQKTRVIKGLDLLRDFAIDANAQTPPLVAEAVTRKVVLYHESALTVIHATDAGWKAATETGLDELLKGLSPSDRQKFGPYVALVKVLLKEAM